MQPALIIKMLFLLTLANGSPVIAKRVLGDRLTWPIDAGIRIFDGQPLFGRSKTIRGLLIAVVATTAGAAAIGWSWQTGLIVGLAAMGGDLFSSFVKRRLRLPASSPAFGLDQIPESLFPLLAAAAAVGLTVEDIVATTAVFLVGELVLSRILFWLRVRDEPY